MNTFVINIERTTIDNDYYRKVLFTTGEQQLVVMSIEPREDIPLEIHQENDQFIRIEAGTGMLYIGENRSTQYELFDGISITVPKNTWHQVVNTSDSTKLKIYTIYSPPHHPIGTIDKTRSDAELREQQEQTHNERIIDAQWHSDTKA